MPPTPWPSRYATCIPRRRFHCRRNPALEVWVESAVKHGMGSATRGIFSQHTAAYVQDRGPGANPLHLRKPKIAAAQVCGDGGGGRYRALPLGGWRASVERSPEYAGGPPGPADTHLKGNTRGDVCHRTQEQILCHAL